MVVYKKEESEACMFNILPLIIQTRFKTRPREWKEMWSAVRRERKGGRQRWILHNLEGKRNHWKICFSSLTTWKNWFFSSSFFTRCFHSIYIRLLPHLLMPQNLFCLQTNVDFREKEVQVISKMLVMKKKKVNENVEFKAMIDKAFKRNLISCKA